MENDALNELFSTDPNIRYLANKTLDEWLVEELDKYEKEKQADGTRFLF